MSWNIAGFDLPVFKEFARRLQLQMKRGNPPVEIPLNVLHEAMARTLKHANWHDAELALASTRTPNKTEHERVTPTVKKSDDGSPAVLTAVPATPVMKVRPSLPQRISKTATSENWLQNTLENAYEILMKMNKDEYHRHPVSLLLQDNDKKEWAERKEKWFQLFREGPQAVLVDFKEKKFLWEEEQAKRNNFQQDMDQIIGEDIIGDVLKKSKFRVLRHYHNYSDFAVYRRDMEFMLELILDAAPPSEKIAWADCISSMLQDNPLKAQSLSENIDEITNPIHAQDNFSVLGVKAAFYCSDEAQWEKIKPLRKGEGLFKNPIFKYTWMLNRNAEDAENGMGFVTERGLKISPAVFDAKPVVDFLIEGKVSANRLAFFAKACPDLMTHHFFKTANPQILEAMDVTIESNQAHFLQAYDNAFAPIQNVTKEKRRDRVRAQAFTIACSRGLRLNPNEPRLCLLMNKMVTNGQREEWNAALMAMDTMKENQIPWSEREAVAGVKTNQKAILVDAILSNISLSLERLDQKTNRGIQANPETMDAYEKIERLLNMGENPKLMCHITTLVKTAHIDAPIIQRMMKTYVSNIALDSPHWLSLFNNSLQSKTPQKAFKFVEQLGGSLAQVVKGNEAEQSISLFLKAALLGDNLPLLEQVFDIIKKSGKKSFQKLAKRIFEECQGWTQAMLYPGPDDTKMLKAIVEGGMDVDGQDDEGWTVLAKAKSPQQVSYLLSQGARVYAQGETSPSPLEAWLQLPDEKFYAFTEKVIEAGYNLKDVNPLFGGNLLHAAASQASPDIFTWLLDRGLDVDTLDDFGKTPSEIIKSNRWDDAIKIDMVARLNNVKSFSVKGTRKLS